MYRMYQDYVTSFALVAIRSFSVAVFVAGSCTGYSAAAAAQAKANGCCHAAYEW